MLNRRNEPDAVGITMLTSDPNIRPGFTNTTGNIDELLLPGTYDLTFSSVGVPPAG